MEPASDSAGRGLVRVVLDIDPAGAVPTGWVSDGDGNARSFSSWLELLDGVDLVLARAMRDRPPDAS